jgi:hypothetical protein
MRCQLSKSFKAFPTQRKALLKDIGGIDPTDNNLIIFDLKYHIPRIPPQLAFQIEVVYGKQEYL